MNSKNNYKSKMSHLVEGIFSLLNQSPTRTFPCWSNSSKNARLLLELLFRENFHCLQNFKFYIRK